jgi:2-phosphosulfolactate phosphatase
VAFRASRENRIIDVFNHFHPIAMPDSLAVHFLPALTTPEELAGGTVVVVDILRASTTITAALAAGAREVVPCLEVDEARGKKAGDSLLGGERGGLPIEGFDLGNSPSEYTAQRVRSRTVVFTTTNGTQALRVCNSAKRVLIGAFVNLSAVAKVLQNEGLVHVLCAGTRGRITREDVMFAGALVEVLLDRSKIPHENINDQARIARDVWRQAMSGIRLTDPAAREQLAAALRETQGGLNLTSIGLERDIPDAADIDRYQIVPQYDARSGRIVM